MRGTIKKWGNSHGVRLPKSILEEAHIKENDEVDFYVVDGIIQIKAVKQPITLKERFASYTTEELKSSEWDTGSPEGKEVW